MFSVTDGVILVTIEKFLNTIAQFNNQKLVAI